MAGTGAGLQQGVRASGPAGEYIGAGRRSAAVVERGRGEKTIVGFVDRVTRQGGPDFVPPAERIATFDNDGTLWSEKPVPFQLLFAFDRVKALAAQHPDWTTRQPFASLLAGNMAGVAAAERKACSRSWQRRTRG